MKGDRHIKPCGYNCRCNAGRQSWTECSNCPDRRRSPFTEEKIKFDDLGYAMLIGAMLPGVNRRLRIALLNQGVEYLNRAERLSRLEERI